jgi:hypothetical protein
MADPNVSALNQALTLQLMFDATAANESLNRLETSFAKVSDDFAKSAEMVFSSVNRTYQNIQANLIDINRYQEIALATAIKENAELDKYSKQTDILDDYQKTEKKWWKEILKNYDTLIEKIEYKNKLHDIENDSVEKEIKNWKQLSDLVDANNKKNKDNEITWRDIENAAKRMMGYLKATDAIAENFVTTNYRAYGSQSLLAQETRATAMEFGILHDQAAEAMQVVMNMKVPKEEVEGYVVAIARANRYLGIATKTLGDHAFRMRQVGMNAEDVEKRYNLLAEAMRKYKLSAEDAAKVIAESNWSPATMEVIFGKDANQKFEAARAAWSGWAGTVGVSTDQVIKIMDNAQNFESLAMLSGLVPQGIRQGEEGINDLMEAMAELGHRADILMAQQKLGGKQATDAENELETMANVYKMASINDLTALGIMHRKSIETGVNILKMEELTTATEKYKDSTMTLTQQLKTLGSNMFSLLGTVLEPVRYVLMWINIGIREMVEYLAPLIKQFRDWWMATEEAGGALGGLFKVLRVGTGVILGLGMLLIMVGASITGVVAACGNFKFIGAGILRIAVALKALGKALLPLARAALEFGIGLLAAGAGAWLFAEALQKLVDIMKSSNTGVRDLAIGVGILVGAMIAFAVAAKFVMNGLATMAPAAVEAAPVLGMLAIGMLALGASAWLIGQAWKLAGEGIEYAGKGIERMGNAVILAGTGMKSLGEGLLLVATNNLGVWGWAKLAGGLTAVALASGDAAPNMQKIATILGQMASDKILKLAEGLVALGDLLKNLSTMAGMSNSAIDALEKLRLAGPAITELVVSLKNAGSNLQLVAPMFTEISNALRQLSTVLKEFGTQATILRTVGDNFVSFAQSMLLSGAMLRVAFSQFGWLSLIRTITFLRLMTEALEEYATRLAVASDKFIKPANQLTASLIGLGNAVASFEGIGDRLAINLENLVKPLDIYTAQLEAAAERMENAVQNKLLPAVRAAQQAGVQEAIRAEAINNVEIMPPKTEDKNQVRTVALLEQQNQLLQSLTEIIGKFSTDDVTKIRELMEDRQGQLADVVPNLSSDLNGWT